LNKQKVTKIWVTKGQSLGKCAALAAVNLLKAAKTLIEIRQHGICNEEYSGTILNDKPDVKIS
jgi:hypothetical protein